ncbi:MAG: DNA primase [Oscillospiraceae bacterium]
MAFSEKFLEELAARNDIADVVGSYVQLTKRSGANLFGLCPFHSEKTPSFSVSPDKQIYHCFGCGKGGGVINFIMEIENLGFADSVHFLAKRAGMTVPDDDVPDEVKSRRARLLELNRDAARFFYDCLGSEAGKTATEYISRRGISGAMVRRFGLGSAPDSWNTLADAMVKRGYTQGELLEAGLCKKGKNGGVYDAFRNRLMFPVIDVRGSVIGFSGRILGDGEPKYLNSPETLVFSKSRNLFALNLAKKNKHGMLILAEGNIDVVSLHQAGFDCAVASLGTSLTAEQARLMSRYTDKVVIAYDSDSAGVKAAQRAIGILEKTGLGVKVLRMEGSKDPDEYIQKKGADAFSLLLERSENHIEYRILTAKAKYDIETDEGRLGFLAEATEMLSSVPNAVEREVYGIRVAEMTGVTADAIQNEIKKAYRRRIMQQDKKRDREIVKPAVSSQPKDREIRYDNIFSAVAEEGVIRLLLIDPTLTARLEDLKQEDFTAPFLGKVFGIITNNAQEGRQTTIATLTPFFTPAEMSQLTAVLQKPETPGNGETALRDYIEKIKTEKMKTPGEGDIMAVREKYREKKGFGG